MSAAISIQETLSPEGANACHFLVVYEDAVAHDLAMEVCSGVVARLETELAFKFSFWKFKDLNDPVSARWVAEAVARADILLFALPGHDLAPEAMDWLDACARTRTKTEGALALIIAGPAGPVLAVEALLSRMQFAAYRLRMDFLPLLSSGLSADLMQALSPEASTEPGSTHWGLNE